MRRRIHARLQHLPAVLPRHETRGRRVEEAPNLIYCPLEAACIVVYLYTIDTRYVHVRYTLGTR